LFFQFAGLIEQHRASLAPLETLDNGKPHGDSDFDIGMAIDCLRYFAGWSDKIHGDTIPVDGNFMSITRKEPVGVVGSIIPWNYPVLMAAWKLAPALATGCVIILKVNILMLHNISYLMRMISLRSKHR
jgi:aldehyde dehydrogenase (NAD+)